MALTESIGIAKPTPAEVPVLVKMAVFTPITRPCESRRGPPEFPGLMAASVWIPPGMTLPAEVGSITGSDFVFKTKQNMFGIL